MTYKLIHFKHEDIETDVYQSSEDNSIWLSKEQMSILFQKKKRTIESQIRRFCLLNEPSLFKMNTKVHKLYREENGFKRTINIYDSNTVIGVGYQVKSLITPIFKEWVDSLINNQFVDEESNIIRFNDGDLSIDVRIMPKEETVYLNKEELSILFETTRQNIEYHIANIYETNELEIGATCKEILQVQLEGNREVTRSVDYYNLDMIISIGYRVNTKRGIAFRRWASNVLKQYLLKGYAINQERAVITKENYIDLVNIVNSLDVRVRKIEEKESYYLIEDKVIFENTLFDAEVIINQIIETASSCIHLIDPYGDIRTLNAFKGKKKEVPLIIITGKHHKISDVDKDNFHKKYGEIKIYVNKKYHDRYLIIDKKMFYHLGSSVNYLGKKFSQITIVEDAEIMNVLKQRVNNYM